MSNVKKLKIENCFEIIFPKQNDSRGYFQRIINFDKILKNKKRYLASQISVSFNKKKEHLEVFTSKGNLFKKIN